MAKQPFENVVHHLFQIAARAEFKTLSDQDLLKRYVEQRDDLAFGELVRRYKEMIWYVCWRVLRHPQDVEDAFQATIMTLVRRANTILSRETIEGWLHKTAFKVASNSKVARSRLRAREERSAMMWRESDESHEGQWELREVLDRELTCIPEKYRNPLLLCYLEGLTWNEAAQRLGISLDSLEWRLEQGRAQLKKRLSRYDIDWGPTMLLPQAMPGVHIPKVPPGLVERTLDMARILTLSNCAWETAGISPQVTVLVKGALGLGTTKAKILVGILLMTLAVAGGGIATYSGWLRLGGEQRQEKRIEHDNKTPGEPKTDEKWPPRADRYGDPLPPGALERLGTVRFRCDKFNADDRMAVTPDKKLFLLGSAYADRAYPLRCYDLPTGKPVQQIQDAHGRAIPLTHDVAMSVDGRLLARRIALGGDFAFWNMMTGEPLDLRMKNPPQEMALSRDGNTVAVMTRTTDQGGFYLCVWDNVAGRKRWSKDDKGYPPLQLVYSSQGKILLAACQPEFKELAAPKELIVRRWDVATGRELPRWTVPQEGSFTWSHDGGTLAVGPTWRGHTIQIWDMVSGKVIQKICLSDNAAMECMMLSPDGKILVGKAIFVDGEVHGSLCFWDAATGKLLRQWDRSTWGGRWTFSSDGQWLVSVPRAGDIDRFIHIWDVESGKLVNQAWQERGHHDAVTSLVFSPHGETLASGCRGGSAIRWRADAETSGYSMHPTRLYSHRTHESHLATVAPNGKIAAHVDRKQVHLWETATGQVINSFPVSQMIHLRLVFSPNSKMLALQAANWQGSRVFLYDVSTGACLNESSVPGRSFAFSPNGRWLAIGGKDKFYLWDTATGNNVAWESTSQIVDIAFAPDGRTLAVSAKVKGLHDLICLWRLFTDDSGVRLEGPHPLVMAPLGTEFSLLTFSPDGKTLAARRRVARQNHCHASDVAIHLWETATGQECGHFNDQGSFVHSLAFTPDGRRLASGHEDGTILIWDVTGMRSAKSHLVRDPQTYRTQEAQVSLDCGKHAHHLQ